MYQNIVLDLNQKFARFQHLEKLLTILSQYTSNVRIIGGAVRDAILDKDFDDIDIATDLSPDMLVKIAVEHDISYHDVGAKFGTIAFIFSDGSTECFEVTTLRKDIACDGRYATTLFTDSFEEDASRRDFTINAMSYDYFSHEIHDYFCGIDDLYCRRVVFIGDAHIRISEDYLRILRFLRFSVHYAAYVDEETLAICQQYFEHISILSKERIMNEIWKILFVDWNRQLAESIRLLSKSIYDSMWKAMHTIWPYICGPYRIKLTALDSLQFHSKHSAIELLSILLYGNPIESVVHWMMFMHCSKKQINSVKYNIELLQKCETFVNFNDLEMCIRIAAFEYNKKSKTSDILYNIRLLKTASIINNSKYNLLLQKYSKINIGHFPITAEDLLNIGIESRFLGKTIKELQKIWISSNFTASKMDILNVAKLS